MERFALSIGAYDSIMLPEVTGRFVPDELMEVIAQGHLPRPEEAVLDTDTPGLRKLFDALDFPVDQEKPRPYRPSWQRLAGLAVSGELLATWEGLKSENRQE